MVSTISIALMCVSLIFAISIPIVLAIVIKKKYRASLTVFFTGCIVWFLFAMVLEQLLHTAVLGSSIGATIQGNLWLYAIYGGLAAGIFEETGRFIAMKTVLRYRYKNPYNSLMYGAGHGGFEAFFILGTGMVNNIIYSVLINTGNQEVLLSSVNGAQKEMVQAAFQSLIETKPYLFLMGDIERISAVILHIALSVFVWTAVVKGKTFFYPIAVLLHAIVDAAIVIISRCGVSILIVELITLLLSLVIAFFAWRLWKKQDLSEDDTPEILRF